ncbi:hypothetical protein [Actinoplanes siamensis]|uniref:Knr4/Smi1-like domain-containing protein n=1 Tax=Actinoplanes siamensis TaxID=1223317 RepID=A0A919TJU3_9ACTN|nr:hypothetical protein [Actinoplanes siamensis]GIF05002.1 hypothetical protein Asi03nite_25400 [Actinoplanes siamensis]
MRSHNYAERLIDVLGVTQRVVPCSWDAVEEAIGQPIPGDYKTFIGHTGSACIDDRLCVFGPNPSESVDIGHMIESLDQGWQYLRENDVDLPEEFFAEGRRLITFAAVQENYFFWDAREGVAPDDWGVVIVDADLEGWHELDMSATECIYKVMVREIDIKPFGQFFGRTEHDIGFFGTE